MGSRWGALHPSFDLVQEGRSMNMLLVERPVGSPALPLSTVPFVSAVEDSWFDVDDLLEPPRQLPTNLLDLHQQIPQMPFDARDMLEVTFSAPSTTLEPSRDELTGAITGFHEVPIEDADSTAQNSFSLLRQPANPSDFVRGRTTFRPFQPGGFVDFSDGGLDSFDGKEAAVIEDDLDRLEIGSAQIGAGIIAEPTGLYRIVDVGNSDAAPSVASFSLFDNEAELALDWNSTKESNAPTAAPKEPVAAKGSAPAASEMEASLDALPTELELHVRSLPQGRVTAPTHKYARVLDANQDMTNFHQLVPDMAIKYPFELDTFQKQAVYRLEQGDCVFVAAHTSAGKTVVAEYAIALAQKHMTRAIYTSPIKALSNQKYRDFTKTFESVGLLTGDVQINKEASCLIMTTEILRSMLYRGADLIRDVEWVIFDEVHYVNDAERGVVWEEVIIMLPAHVGIIMLSATVPNYVEFAEWVGRTKQKEVYVISTFKRPVPLEYFLFSQKEIFKIVDARREFLMDGHKRAVEAANRTKKAAPAGPGRGGASSSSAPVRRGPPSDAADRQNWISLVTFLRDKSLLPVVCFTLSKRRCESNAHGLSAMDLTSTTEKSEIRLFLQTSLQRLKEVDRALPQILRMKEMMMRGIGVHHGGLLPIVKEMVEILFARGWIKVLFATETFAMGVNMPARTVVFNDLGKHDGTNKRDLLPGEFTQMAGRAGRRGLDPVGTVIVPCWDKVPDTSQLHAVMLGPPTKLESKFRLTYLMILNLLRVEELRVEDMMKRSFSESRTQADVPAQQRELKSGRERLQKLSKLACMTCVPGINEYYAQMSEYLDASRVVRQAVLQSSVGDKALAPGRVVVLNCPGFVYAPAVVLRVTNPDGGKGGPQGALIRRTVTVLTLSPPSDRSQAMPVPSRVQIQLSLPTGAVVPTVSDVTLSDILVLAQQRVNVQDASSESDRAQIAQRLLQLASQSAGGFEPLNPAKDLKLNSLEIVEQQHRTTELARRLQSEADFGCLKCPDFDQHYAVIHEQKTLQRELSEIEVRLSDRNLTLLPEYHRRLAVLRTLGYVDQDNIVQLKGRVACELTNSDEVLVTELVMENVLDDLQPAELVALLSCFVFQEKTQSPPVLTDRLQKRVEEFRRVATNVGNVQVECGLSIAVSDYVALLNFNLAEVVYEWANGMSFKQITDLTDVPEGSIVRCIVRLDETCRDVRNAARVIGDNRLFNLAAEASALIKRDIIFAASLYYA